MMLRNTQKQEQEDPTLNISQIIVLLNACFLHLVKIRWEVLVLGCHLKCIFRFHPMRILLEVKMCVMTLSNMRKMVMDITMT